MKKLILVMVAAAPLALVGCTTAEQTGVGGAAVGAAVGGLATGTTGGALGGALIGGTAGYLLGRSADREGYCRYRGHDRYGRTVYYERRCR
jgi:NhaP-type Na+/H+ or K+/H+ antiporter